MSNNFTDDSFAIMNLDNLSSPMKVVDIDYFKDKELRSMIYNSFENYLIFGLGDFANTILDYIARRDKDIELKLSKLRGTKNSDTQIQKRYLEWRIQSNKDILPVLIDNTKYIKITDIYGYLNIEI